MIRPLRTFHRWIFPLLAAALALLLVAALGGRADDPLTPSGSPPSETAP